MEYALTASPSRQRVQSEQRMAKWDSALEIVMQVTMVLLVILMLGWTAQIDFSPRSDLLSVPSASLELHNLHLATAR